MRYLIIILMLMSCNPVKMVLKDDAKFNVVAKEVIRRGYCVSDTVVKVVDSTVYVDSIIDLTIPCDSSGEAKIDTVIKVSNKVIYKTQTIQDKSLENVLKEDVRERDSIIAKLKIDNKIECLKIKEENLSLSRANFWYKVKLVSAIFAVVLLAFKKPILKLLRLV